MSIDNSTSEEMPDENTSRSSAEDLTNPNLVISEQSNASSPIRTDEEPTHQPTILAESATDGTKDVTEPSTDATVPKEPVEMSTVVTRRAAESEATPGLVKQKRIRIE